MSCVVAEASLPSVPSSAPVSGDIETIVQWAIKRTGRLPWSNSTDAELSLDRGLTAQPRRKPRGRWYLVEACAGLNFGFGRVYPMKTPGSDAAMVIEAIKRLPAEQASAVLMFARARRRPDWVEDLPLPRPVYRADKAGEVKVVRHKGWGRKKRNVPPYCPLHWPLDPEAICAARRVYSLWHAGMTRLAQLLDGELTRWRNVHFAARPAPWDAA